MIFSDIKLKVSKRVKEQDKVMIYPSLESRDEGRLQIQSHVGHCPVHQDNPQPEKERYSMNFESDAEEGRRKQHQYQSRMVSSMALQFM